MNESRIRVWTGDITELDVDAIVNAANEGLIGGGGVDGAIHRAAGPELLRACLAIPEVERFVRCPTGEARITPGFDLPAAHVIHTVGPVWRHGLRGERRLLASCYRASMILADETGLRSIAFPAISCGVYGYPIRRACRVAINEVADVLEETDSLESVTMVAWGGDVGNALNRSLRRRSRRAARARR